MEHKNVLNFFMYCFCFKIILTLKEFFTFENPVAELISTETYKIIFLKPYLESGYRELDYYAFSVTMNVFIYNPDLFSYLLYLA